MTSPNDSLPVRTPGSPSAQHGASTNPAPQQGNLQPETSPRKPNSGLQTNRIGIPAPTSADINAVTAGLDPVLTLIPAITPEALPAGNESYINTHTSASLLPMGKGYAATFSASWRKAAEYLPYSTPPYTTHSLFFDYDRDNDLDCYLLNHSIDEPELDAAFVKKMTTNCFGDKLFSQRRRQVHRSVQSRRHPK